MGNNVIIGSARIDENKHSKGGKAGDQTGIEVSTQKWYKHTKGWNVFRPIDPKQAEYIANDCEYACMNTCIGYDQNQRDTLYEVSKKVGFNCSKVETPCETDCSALVRVCCAYAGIYLPNFNTSNERQVLLNSYKFKQMTGTKYEDTSKYLLRGDILCTKTQGHTVIVLSNGEKADVLTDKVIHPYVLVTGDTVYIRSEHNKESEILFIVKKGCRLEYTGQTYKTWYSIRYREKDGWITSKYSTLIQ